MKPADKEQFLTLLADVFAFYKQPFSAFAGNVWWEAMRPYDFAAVSGAFSRHAVNPDSGQFLPKPADVVRMIGGTSNDAALSAWSKVDRAIRSIGTYETVAFDDPIIHRVISDMGGWVKLGSCPSEEEFVFVAKEFQNRYRGFAMRAEVPEYPRKLIGIAEAQNAERSIQAQPRILLLGDQAKAISVYKGGAESLRLLATELPQASEMLRLGRADNLEVA